LSQAAFFQQEERGWYWHRIFPVQFSGKPQQSLVHIIRVPVDQLPENTCPHHRDLIIPPAVAFAKNRALYEAGDLFMSMASAVSIADQDELRTAVAQVMRLIPRGRYGTALHTELRRLMPIFAFEAVLFRRSQESGKVEVFMAQRPNEGAYPLQYHCPGASADSSNFEGEDVNPILKMFERVNHKEFGGALGDYTHVGDCYSRSQWDVGAESKVFLVEATVEPPVTCGEWYDACDLPASTVAVHRDKIIPMALEAYRAKEVK
jgi:hypothetical protein